MQQSSDFNILVDFSPVNDFHLQIEVAGSRCWNWRNRDIRVFLMIAIETTVSESDIQTIHIITFDIVMIISFVYTVPIDHCRENFCFSLISGCFQQSRLHLYFCRRLGTIVFHYIMCVRRIVDRSSICNIAVESG